MKNKKIDEIMTKYKPQNEINFALKKFLTDKITEQQYEKIVNIYKPIQD